MVCGFEGLSGWFIVLEQVQSQESTRRTPERLARRCYEGTRRSSVELFAVIDGMSADHFAAKPS